MTETSDQVPERYFRDLGLASGAKQDSIKKDVKTEHRAKECARLLNHYLTALQARDKFYKEGKGKIWTESFGVLTDRSRLKPEENDEAAKTARILQDAVKVALDRLEPFGFKFHYSGRLISNKCYGFAAEFLTKPKFDKFREGLDLKMAEFQESPK